VLAQTLLLLHWLFDFELSKPAQMFATAYQEQAVVNAQIALAEIVDSNEISLPANLIIQRYHRRERILHWLSRYALRQGDMRVVPLPMSLIWMYPLMRPFSILARRLFRSNAGKMNRVEVH